MIHVLTSFVIYAYSSALTVSNNISAYAIDIRYKTDVYALWCFAYTRNVCVEVTSRV